MSEPLTPKGARTERELRVPRQVVEAINDLLVKNLRGEGASARAQFTQAELNALVMEKFHRDQVDVTIDQAYKNGWFEFRSLFKSQGWQIKYDRPAYNENYDAYYVFEQAPRNED